VTGLVRRIQGRAALQDLDGLVELRTAVPDRLVVEAGQRPAGLGIVRILLGYLLIEGLRLVHAVVLLIEAGQRELRLGVLGRVFDEVLGVAMGLVEVLEGLVGVDRGEEAQRVLANLLEVVGVRRVHLEGLLVVFDGLVEMRLVLGRLLARPIEGLMGVAEIEVRLGHLRIELDRALILLDRLPEVFQLIFLVAVLVGRASPDLRAARAEQGRQQQGQEDGPEPSRHGTFLQRGILWVQGACSLEKENYSGPFRRASRQA
jgi:hypothetical protein